MSSSESAAPVPPADDASWNHRFADVNGVRLHYAEAGAGPLVVLLHGFPEFWYAWRRQIPRLAAAGFRVIAPDLRGYNLSAKPRGVAAYRLRALADDVSGLIAHAGASRASVVGHDWGAVIAWATAMRHPGSVERLSVLNGPHPVRMLRSLANPRQLWRSLYILFFQLPWLPEQVVRSNHYQALLRTFELGGTGWSPHEREAYREAYEVPGAMAAMLAYYRALSRPALPVRPRRVDVPVQVLWGERDPYLGRQLARPGSWAPRAHVEYLPELGHFIQHEAPELVSDRIVSFLLQAEDRADAPPTSRVIAQRSATPA